MSYFDINSYLSGAESRWSGMNGTGYDSYHGIDNNLNLDLSFDGDSNATGPATPAPTMANGGLKQAAPYQLVVANTTGGTLTAVLFGYNQYILTTNFGSATGITITPGQSNVTYTQVLTQSASQPFDTNLLRVSSSNTTQVQNIITITSNDANGQLCQIPLIPQNYFSAQQYQATIIDIPYPIRIDGTTNLQFSVLANTTVTLTFFPANKANLSRDLNNQPTLQQYGTPNVPITSQPLYVRPEMFRQALGN